MHFHGLHLSPNHMVPDTSPKAEVLKQDRHNLFRVGAHECMLVEEYSVLLTELCLLPTWLISIPQSATHLA